MYMYNDNKKMGCRIYNQIDSDFRQLIDKFLHLFYFCLSKEFILYSLKQEPIKL